MHSKQGIELYKKAIEEAKRQGGNIEFGGKVLLKVNANFHGLWHKNCISLQFFF